MLRVPCCLEHNLHNLHPLALKIPLFNNLLPWWLRQTSVLLQSFSSGHGSRRAIRCLSWFVYTPSKHLMIQPRSHSHPVSQMFCFYMQSTNVLLDVPIWTGTISKRTNFTKSSPPHQILQQILLVLRIILTTLLRTLPKTRQRTWLMTIL